MTAEERAEIVWPNKRPDGIKHLNDYIVMEERKLPIRVGVKKINDQTSYSQDQRGS